LHWIKTEKKLSVFVQNRIKEIKSNKEINFEHVAGDQNPADIASRGCFVKRICDSELWWHGLQWLLQPENTLADRITCEQDPCVTNYNSTDLVMKASAMEEDSTTIVTPPFEIDSEKYSSFTNLLRVSV
jgi:hypothetical protein